ncbi:MAG: hypothetical protein O9972_46425, partial [Burkholderiales bacterium]|nr:hypothetical protein [Burkholderiales bacterium]
MSHVSQRNGGGRRGARLIRAADRVGRVRLVLVVADLGRLAGSVVIGPVIPIDPVLAGGGDRAP